MALKKRCETEIWQRRLIIKLKRWKRSAKGCGPWEMRWRNRIKTANRDKVKQNLTNVQTVRILWDASRVAMALPATMVALR